MHKLYCTLVLPYLNYGLLLWGNVNKVYLNKVFKLQRRALEDNFKQFLLSIIKTFVQKTQCAGYFFISI